MPKFAKKIVINLGNYSQDFLKAISLVDPQFNGSKYLALETIAKGV